MKMRAISLMCKNLGPHSQDFVTYDWANKLECLLLASPYNLVQCNAQAYWAYFEMKCSESVC
jgi:hypothetical protein